MYQTEAKQEADKTMDDGSRFEVHKVVWGQHWLAPNAGLYTWCSEASWIRIKEASVRYPIHPTHTCTTCVWRQNHRVIPLGMEWYVQWKRPVNLALLDNACPRHLFLPTPHFLPSDIGILPTLMSKHRFILRLTCGFWVKMWHSLDIPFHMTKGAGLPNGWPSRKCDALHARRKKGQSVCSASLLKAFFEHQRQPWWLTSRRNCFRRKVTNVFKKVLSSDKCHVILRNERSL